MSRFLMVHCVCFNFSR